MKNAILLMALIGGVVGGLLGLTAEVPAAREAAASLRQVSIAQVERPGRVASAGSREILGGLEERRAASSAVSVVASHFRVVRAPVVVDAEPIELVPRPVDDPAIGGEAGFTYLPRFRLGP